MSLYGYHDEKHIYRRYRHYPSFIRLFRLEFDALLDVPAFVNSLLKKLQSKLGESAYETLQCQLDRSDEEPSFTDDQKAALFKALSLVNDAQTKFWYWLQDQLFDYATEKNDRDLTIMLGNPPTYEKEHFDEFFDDTIPNKLDIMMGVMMPVQCMEVLEALPIEAYKDIWKVHVEPIMKNKDRPEYIYYACCELIRRLFYCHPGIVDEKERSWYMDFMFACTKNSRNAAALQFLDQKYYIRLDRYITMLNAKANLGIFDESDLVDPAEEKEIAFRPPLPHAQEFLNYGLDEPDRQHTNTLALRSYQAELARFANDGINTVICAPTGSGKTIVAIDIIRTHLEKRNHNLNGTNCERSRAVFIVPTVPLVEQQQAVIEQYLGSQFTVKGFSGADRIPVEKRTFEILTSHIAVITPQMFINLLQDIHKSQRLYLSDFTLFVLDECHHCDANHPYEVLMKKVRDYVEDPNRKGETPQIVGLTASLGTKKQIYEPHRTEQHILSLCVRMLATQISTVRAKANMDELRRHVNLPIDEICRVKRPLHDQFRVLMCAIVSKVVAYIEPIVNEAKSLVVGMESFQFTDPSEPGYRTLIERLYESTSRWPVVYDSDMPLIRTVIDHLRIYLHGMKVNELAPAYFAYLYIEDKFKEMLEGQNLNQELIQIYLDNKAELAEVAMKDSGSHKQILQRFIEVLDQEYTKNPDTLTLIFVETRYYTRYLSEMLDNSSKMKKHFGDEKRTSYLTSTNQSKKLGGMNSVEQQETIRKFEKGIYKILVVTSVAEEGLDISACNLIIKYNVVGSERTMIQRRGRARAFNSKSVLVCLDDDVEQREIANVVREQMMHQCLSNLQSKSREQLEKLIADKRKQLRSEEMQRENEKNNRMRALEDKVYDLQCAKCNHVLCSSDKIRSVHDTNFCCVQPEVWRNLKTGNSDNPTVQQDCVRCRPFKCKKCDTPLGNIIQFAGTFLPAINAATVAFQQRETITSRRGERPERITQKSWKDMAESYFLIKEIGMDSLFLMTKALFKYDPEGHKQLELDAQYAVQRHLEIMKKKKQRKARYTLDEFNELS